MLKAYLKCILLYVHYIISLRTKLEKLSCVAFSGSGKKKTEMSDGYFKIRKARIIVAILTGGNEMLTRVCLCHGRFCKVPVENATSDCNK